MLVVGIGFRVLDFLSSRTFSDQTEGGVPNNRLVVAAKKKVENKNKNNVKNKSASNITDFSDEEGEERLEAVLNHVCGDINEDSLEQEFDHIFSDLSPVPRKKKSTYATKIKIGKPPKKPRTPSKLRFQ